MSLIKFNWNPTDAQLRLYGLPYLAGLPLAGWLWGGSWQLLGILAAAGFLFTMIGLARPAWLRPFYRLMLCLGAPLGWVVGEVALLVVYFGIVTPLALLLKIIGRDALHRRIDRDAVSYWRPNSDNADAKNADGKGAESYYQQY